MTDKQIAYAYIYNRLNNCIPDHDDLRSIAEQKLTEDRCYKIVQRIIDKLDKLRTPLREHLTKQRIDVV